jgi:hypothetical protein
MDCTSSKLNQNNISNCAAALFNTLQQHINTVSPKKTYQYHQLNKQMNKGEEKSPGYSLVNP